MERVLHVTLKEEIDLLEFVHQNKRKQQYGQLWQLKIKSVIIPIYKVSAETYLVELICWYLGNKLFSIKISDPVLFLLSSTFEHSSLANAHSSSLPALSSSPKEWSNLFYGSVENMKLLVSFLFLLPVVLGEGMLFTEIRHFNSGSSLFASLLNT